MSMQCHFSVMEKSESQDCNDGQKLDENMAPRNQPDGGRETSSDNKNVGGVNDADIAEIAAVNESLDSLNNALDLIEERTDGIKARLLELLNSNKEIRESIHAENEQRNKESEN